MKRVHYALPLALAAHALWAVSGGSLTGTIKDPSGAVIPHARITLTNTGLQTVFKTTADGQGEYTFPSLAVGRYDLSVEAPGFQPQRKTNIGIDADSAVRVDAQLDIGQEASQVTVSEAAADVDTQVDTVATHLGEVVSDTQIEAIPLNGRSYTDLLAIQPGVSPATSLTATSVVMAGVTGTINPSGDLNPGDVSIDGQRESANGFMVNGTDVQEHMNGGTSVIPNLDSIQEFRVLTNNFDPEYGNYNGGMINVVTKSGSNSYHGTAFEFLRNTDLDARYFFDDSRGIFRQNQFGGALGGPIVKQKLFFFADYQGTRTVEGMASPVSQVMSAQERAGNFSDALSTLTGKVSGPNVAEILTNELGYPVTTGECYCGVFPDGIIPTRAWSAPAKNLLQYIPTANIGSNLFSTSDYPETVRDDKGAGRIDANTRVGEISGYYFIDDYRLDNPYPAGQGGATVPGFDALTIGRAQLLTLGDTKVIGPTMVNEFRAGFVRNVNDIGQPHGGTSASIASQGFVTGPGTAGIVVQAPQYEGVENLVFPSFVMGVPITNTLQWSNTLYVSDSLTKVMGPHTLKLGGQFHNDQVNSNPNATFNGTFSFLGTETGNPFADFLLGLPSNYTQTSGQRFYLRNRYEGTFVEDSWHARSNLTVNLGLRWDIIAPWNEKYNNIQTIIPGAQSVLYPNAPPGLVVPGDPGIPAGLSPTRYNNLAPRIGLAYSPKFDSGFLHLLFGDSGKSSIRSSYGIFYTAFPGLSAGVMYGVPPFGYNYLSPSPPLFATPFINAGDGVRNTDPFPLNFPPHSVSSQHPFTGFDFASVVPISADPYWYYKNVVPYTENYMFSMQRQFGLSALLTVSYVGNEGHHLIVTDPTNPGNPKLCMSLPGCGPFGEDGARKGLGSNYGPVTAQTSIGNSDFNALEVNFRYALGKRMTLLAGYTYAKSIDDASNLGEQINPFNMALTRVISSWDITHNMVISYTYALPFDRYFGHSRLAEGWSLSGTTRFSTGFPVTLADVSDNSLLGTLGNGINNQLLDTPEISRGRFSSIPTPVTARPFSTRISSPKRRPDNWATPRAVSFMAPALRISICRSVRICASPNSSRLKSASRLLTFSTTRSFSDRPR